MVIDVRRAKSRADDGNVAAGRRLVGLDPLEQLDVALTQALEGVRAGAAGG